MGNGKLVYGDIINPYKLLVKYRILPMDVKKNKKINDAEDSDSDDNYEFNKDDIIYDSDGDDVFKSEYDLYYMYDSLNDKLEKYGVEIFSCGQCCNMDGSFIGWKSSTSVTKGESISGSICMPDEKEIERINKFFKKFYPGQYPDYYIMSSNCDGCT